jgi:hypothetical protein
MIYPLSLLRKQYKYFALGGNDTKGAAGRTDIGYSAGYRQAPGEHLGAFNFYPAVYPNAFFEAEKLQT